MPKGDKKISFRPPHAYERQGQDALDHFHKRIKRSALYEIGDNPIFSEDNLLSIAHTISNDGLTPSTIKSLGALLLKERFNEFNTIITNLDISSIALNTFYELGEEASDIDIAIEKLMVNINTVRLRIEKRIELLSPQIKLNRSCKMAKKKLSTCLIVRSNLLTCLFKIRQAYENEQSPSPPPKSSCLIL